MGGCDGGSGYYYGGGYYGGWPGHWRRRYNLTRWLLGLPQPVAGAVLPSGYAVTNDLAVRYPYARVSQPPYGYAGYGFASGGCGGGY